MYKSSAFARLANWASRETGRPHCFNMAVLLILAWLVTGPLFHFSDTWQLVTNTTTTIITFLMVFLIQNTQYRDTEAIQQCFTFHFLLFTFNFFCSNWPFHDGRP